MNKKQSKRQRDIKSKLMAAICMLLVSSIMMVSTTYAWFTLSTAPEVTGITTAVGANGNLEMALLPQSGALADITSQAGDSVLDIEERNVTWGNLVDLSDSTVYGLDKVTLYPSQLNESNGALATSMLSTPTYGADGRVSELVANTFTGYYNDQTGSFSPDDLYGVRAVGTASGMTDRQLDYRNARSTANTARAQAASLASQSLNNNGSALANIAIEHGMGAADESYDSTDVASLRAIVDDLQKTDGVLDQIEKAYMQYILAYAASATTGDADTVWQAVKGAVEAADATLTSVTSALTGAGASLPTELTTAIAEYNDTVADVVEADAALDTLEATLATDSAATFTWTEISGAMSPLANASAMKVNGYAVSEVKANLGDLVSSITSQGGLIVTMPTGGGVYADIADQCGDYTASVNIERVEYNGIVLNNMAARMETDSSLAPNFYLVAIGSAVELAGAPASGATGTLPISDMYGYIIDMAFRTNAAESNLLLQVAPADRIYSDNTNEETMGGGSSMTFKATTTDFTDDQVKALMGAIRIVFFDPTASNKIIAYAKLDVANATLGTDGWTAKMYLYEVTAGGTVTNYKAPTSEQLDDTTVTLYTATTDADGNTTYTAVAEADRSAITSATTGTYYVAVTETTAAGENRKTDNIIMALTQNTPTALSALVYLDGNNVGNDDVAATAASSMTGTMNLQFASSANLVPMEYAALYQAAGNNTSGGTTTTGTALTAVTVSDTSVTASGTFTDSAVTINLTGVAEGSTVTGVTVGGTAVTTYNYADGVLTFTQEGIAADSAIVITIG